MASQILHFHEECLDILLEGMENEVKNESQRLQFIKGEFRILCVHCTCHKMFSN